MKQFNDENFCLDNETAKELYHNYAANLPIIDYHCHLVPQVVAENKQLRNITEIWLDGDHYKWRAMRTNGINEEFITGKNTSDWEKFEKWAETVPYTLRNPLYHWTHMELKSAFGITDLLSPKTAKDIYEKCNAKISSGTFAPRDILKHYKVEVFCTTDDPIDSLEYHIQIKNEKTDFKMLPTWRADKAMAIENNEAFINYIAQLSAVSGINIKSYAELMLALQKRQDFFEEVGCKLSDHGLEEFYCEDYTNDEIENIFTKILNKEALSTLELRQYKSAALHDLAVMDHAKGWTQQFHYGALRNNNTKMFE